MQVTIANIVPNATPSSNQTYHMFWKFDGEPDGSYRTLPDATTNPSGTIITPSPYQFDTEGSTTEDIWVRAVSACDSSYVLTVPVPGLEFCCPEGYVLAPDGVTCNFTETVPPTYQQIGVCVACSQLSPEYGVNGTKFWSTKNYNSTLSDSNFTLLTSNYWAGNPAGSINNTSCGDPSGTIGTPPSPVNRNGVWLDSNCDGSKNPLSAGSALQFTWQINRTIPGTVFVGLAGDNNFTLNINGTVVASRTNNADTANFTYMYLFPVDLVSGTNYIGVSFVGDGSVNDMGCMIIIANQASEIPTITDDSQIVYVFQTSQLIGATPIDIATCPSGYVLDTSGGSGNYQCVRITTTPGTVCNPT